MNNFWSEFTQLSKELVEVNKVINNNLKSRNKLMENALKDLLNSGGKFLRPAFVLIAHSFGNEQSQDIYTIAAVMEMFHMATLVHDDVIDESKLRRGKETIQHKYGKNFAVYVGDYLFCICFNLLAKCSSAKSIEVDTLSLSRICLGEIEQYQAKFKKEVNIKEYLRRISYKTAELISLSFYAGAVEGKCNKKLTKKLQNIGHNIGMAFQIIDDLLDFKGTEAVVGKPVCNDLKQGIYTLPIIYALQDKNYKIENLLSKEKLSDEDINSIVNTLKDEGYLRKAEKLAQSYTDKAFKLINTLPEGHNKDTLVNVTNKLLTRTF
ncbi:MAG: polyprenyl synthetase family protein [Clostridiales bacterium]|uniref:polyprenyl synthetase family protein n=1 Tax=Clostridium sp. N3C TaxID=1776758 RepID=UPI00092DF889|nr:polyprenyl synthetase family protein [Clostridium sp. N3C]NLZ48167.1 polyprenyl synthetase family protein [Clostridiales bacterium]SCN22275.1 Heptaprenyl diphosphate synthase component 2 [Clostridium sp. N3C]